MSLKYGVSLTPTTNIEPEILLHPNIPKPLHGIAPRVIAGKKWWDEERERAYDTADFYCQACGVAKERAKYFKWLEAHEMYLFDHVNGTLTYDRSVALCHSCHNFIHDGRMKMMVKGGTMDRDKMQEIREHGFKILEAHDLMPAWLHRNRYDTQNAWTDWRIVFNGKEYGPSSRSHADWEAGAWRNWTPDVNNARSKRMGEPLQDNDPMPFGKHQGTALGGVPASYLLWILSASDDLGTPVSVYITNNRAAIEERYDSELADTSIHFGKHKGTKLRDVPASYLLWVSEQTWFGEKPSATADYINNNLDDIAERANSDAEEEEEYQPDNSVGEVKW